MKILKNTFNKMKKNNNYEDVSKNEKEIQAISKLNLRKQSLSSLCLKKESLNTIEARVAVVMDFSGSMSNLYRNNFVQELFERILPIALKFDDNGELESWIFNDYFFRLPEITEENFYNYVENEIIEKFSMGGTSYAPVMKDVLRKYTKEEPSKLPTFVIFITDGDNNDKAETRKLIRKCSGENIFWQFVGIGNSEFEFLKELDDISGRIIDNANFLELNNIDKINDDKLYSLLLNEYPLWEKEARKKNILK